MTPRENDGGRISKRGEPTEPSAEGARLQNALKEYFEAIDRGETPVREDFLTRYPDVAETLRRHFEDEDFLVGMRNSAPAEAAAAPGQPFGDFELLEIIGQGGMGVVYKARQRSLKRTVALKTIRPEHLESAKNRERFRIEAEAAARLDHPAIVSVFQVGEIDGIPFIAMRLLHAGSLVEHLHRYLLDPRASARLIEQVARAVEYAHARGVLHRDLKPGNILFDGEDRPHVVDFGLAKIDDAESLTRSGDLVGTVKYMAPEQASGRRRDICAATDVYSLGAILYELLTGHPPFQADSSVETLRRIVEDEPTAPSRPGSRVSRDIETICLKCLEKSPRRRYVSAGELADDLVRFLEGESIAARRAGAVERVAKWARRRPAVAGLAAMVALSLCVLVLLGLAYQRERRRDRLETFERKVLAAAVKIEFGTALKSAVRGWVRASSAESPRGHTPHGGSHVVAHAEGWNEGPEHWSRYVLGAIAELRDAAPLAPDRLDAHFHLARGLGLLGRLSEEEQHLKAVLQLEPSFEPAAILLAELHDDTAAEPGASDAAQSPAPDSVPEWQTRWVAVHQAFRALAWQDVVDGYTQLLEITVSSEAYLGLRLEALLGRGRARLRLRDFDGAEEDFAAARILWPDLTEPVLLLSKSYVLAGKSDRAERILREVHARAEAPDELALQVIWMYRDIGEWDGVLGWLARIRSPALRERETASYLAGHQHTPEDKERALQAARRAVELDPLDPSARFALARLLEGEAALKELDRILETQPDERLSNQCHVRRLEVLREEGGLNAEGMIRELTELLARTPDSSDLYRKRGRLRGEVGDAAGALHDFEEVLRRDPNDVYTRTLKAEMLHHNGRDEEALREYDRAIRTYPSAAAYSSRGVIRAQNKNLDGAVDDFTEALRLHPTPNAYANRAYARLTQRDLEGSEADCSRWIELDPQNAAAFFRRSEVRLELWDLHGVLADARAALQIKPTPQAYYYRGRAYHSLKETPDAISEYSKMIELIRAEGEKIQDCVRVVLHPGWSLLQFKLFAGTGSGGLRARLESLETGRPLLSAQGDVEISTDPGAEHASAIATDENGFFTQYLVLGPFRNRRGCSPETTAMREDYLCDGSVTESTLVPEAGIELEPSLSWEPCIGDSPYLGEGIPTIRRVETDWNLLDLDKTLYPKNHVLAYAWVYVRNLTGEDLAVGLGVSSAGSVQVKLNDVEVLLRSTCGSDNDVGHPHNLQLGYINRGKVFHNADLMQEALADMTRATEIGRPSEVAHYLRGYFLWRLNDLEGSFAAFNRAVKRFPKSVLSWSGRAWARRDLKDFDGAIHDYTEAIRLDPTSRYESRAFARILEGRLEEDENLTLALSDVEKALRHDENSYGLRGDLKLHMNDVDGALGDFDRSLEKGPKDYRSLVLSGRALALAIAGDYRNALDEACGAMDAIEKEHVKGRDLFRLARVYARASVLVAEDQSEPDRERLSHQYASRAVELLDQSNREGWGTARRIVKESDFRPLGAHAEFRTLSREIGVEGRRTESF